MKAADGSIMNETDLAGPMVFCLAFGATLLLVSVNSALESYTGEIVIVLVHRLVQISSTSHVAEGSGSCVVKVLD